jgi:hypothetical protein
MNLKMSNNIEILQNILPRLNSLISCELRLNGSSRFVTSDYICGFNSTHDISVKVQSFGENFYFKIEYLQNSILEKSCKPTDETINNFLYILEDLIQSSERIKNQARSFPNLTNEDKRDIRLKKLFEKNTYIPLIP